MKTYYKVLIILLLDFFILFLSLYLSVCLRLELIYVPGIKFYFIYLVNIFIFIALALSLNFYKVLFRYFTTSEFKKYIKFSIIFSLFSFVFILIYSPLDFPRSAPLINTFIFSIILISSRYTIASLINYFKKLSYNDEIEDLGSVAIYGAGVMGSIILHSLQKEKKCKNIIFIDDDTNKINRYLNGVKIYKSLEINELIKKYNLNTLIISATNLSHIKKNTIINLLNNSKIKIFNSSNLLDSPSSRLNELVDFKNNFIESKIKNNFLITNKKYYLNEVVLITGGGGSIGSELSRQISSYKFKKLIIADISEYNLFRIKEEIIEIYKSDSIKLENIEYILLDLKDESQILELFDKHRPTMIYHAAAYKHVPIVESNIKIGIKNNFFGTVNLINLSIKFDVKNFLFVSTDKAVNPLNLMGMTKRLGELYLKKIVKNKDLNYSIVRFGNVVGSSGSVIPLFVDQIKNGGPVTVTHKEVTRYFMTIPDAVSLIINTSIVAKGGEIFVLNMGEPKRIYDLAKNLISKTYSISNGTYNPEDIQIKFIGLREGEKLHEEIYVETINSSYSNKNILLSSDTKNENQDITNLYQLLNSKIDKISPKNALNELKDFFNNQ